MTVAGFFNYDHLTLRYEPFPIGLAKPVIDDATYASMLADYPERDRFTYLPKVGHKYSLSEKNNPRQYREVVGGSPIWREFHRWIKSNAFILEVMHALEDRHIQLAHAKPAGNGKRLRKAVRNLLRGRLDLGPRPLSARFEFSMLPADGGNVIPHTDSPGKIITLVVSMVEDGEWPIGLGGGTDVNRPRHQRLAYNELNRQAGFDDMQILETYEFTPNQCVLFIKTFNSWHSVRPMQAEGSTAMRRTLTINIEAA